MDLKNKKVFVTGGAGFIGSHLVDALMEMNCTITVYDNFSTGRKEFLEPYKNSPRLKVIEGDVLDLELLKNSMQGHDFVFHLAANADVRGGIKDTRIDLEQNTIGTWDVLEAMRLANVKKIAFCSSSSVYGEPSDFPTPETYPSVQTSFYGASKLAGEALVEAFCEAFGFQAWIYRFVSLVGERYSHGVVFDFVKKLFKDATKLEILGDGKQKKSYLYVKDCIDGILLGVEKAKDKVNIFNLGHNDYIEVDEVADIVVDEMHLGKINYKHTGGTRGWIGDAPVVLLSIEKISDFDWEPKVDIEEGIRRTVRFLVENTYLLERK